MFNQNINDLSYQEIEIKPVITENKYSTENNLVTFMENSNSISDDDNIIFDNNKLTKKYKNNNIITNIYFGGLTILAIYGAFNLMVKNNILPKTK